MRTLVGLLVLASASVASAESYDAAQPAPPPKDAYVMVGAELGGQRALMGGLSLDGGVRLGDTPLFAHARVTTGASGSDGSYQQLRAGVESRGCIAQGWVCAFAGLDLGYQHDHMIDKPWFWWGGDDGSGEPPIMETDAHDLMAVPRVGVELGTPIRVRAALDIPFTTRLDEPETRAGAAVSLGLGYAF